MPATHPTFSITRNRRFGVRGRRYAAAACGLLVGLFPVQSNAQGKVTFQEHVLPVVEAHCAKCHNADKQKGDLDLTSYAGVLKGGGTGAVVQSGVPDSSKLLRVVTHDEEPTMPPNRPKLGDKEIEVFRRWIQDGLLDNSGSKAIAASRLNVDLTLKLTQEGKPVGEPAMPKGMSTQSAVQTRHAGPVLSIAASPWAPLVAVTGQKQVLLYHSESLELLGILPFSQGQPQLVRFSRSGNLVMAAGGRGGLSGRVALWDVVTGNSVAVFGDEYDVALAADLSPDQSRVALGGPSRLVKIHSTRTGELEQKIKKHTDWVTAIAFSPNGLLLASADRNGNIHVWDPENAQEIFALSGHAGAVRSVAWRGDSKLLASGSDDGTLKTWEMESGKVVKSWPAHEGGVLGIDFSHDGLIASCGRNGKIRYWDINGNKKRSMETTNELPLGVAFSHDGKRLIAGTFSGKVYAWTSVDGKVAGKTAPNPPVTAAAKSASVGK